MAESVRIGHSLNEAEKQYVTSRRARVQQCLKNNDIPCTLEEVPNIALIASGGGERAMVGLLGSLEQLREEGLLDCMLYLAGVSGSTWCMASLYQELHWSSKPSVTEAIVKRLSLGLWDMPCREEMKAKLKKYYSQYDNYSLTHFWSAMVVPTVVKEIDEHVLSAQRGRDSLDPYPIYTVIDKKINQQDGNVSDNVWFEMTPNEAGYSLTGAFVDQAHFGSQFNKGKQIKQQPEMDMSYVQGVCGSVLSDKKILLDHTLDHIMAFLKDLNCQCQRCDVLQTMVETHIRVLELKEHSDLAEKLNTLLEGKVDKTGKKVFLDTNDEMPLEMIKDKLKDHTLNVSECFLDWFHDLTKDCVTATIWLEIIWSTIKCVMHWTWGTSYNFLYNMPALPEADKILDTKTRDYEDAGPQLNSPYFSVLRKERDIDLIISLDFSVENPVKTLQQASGMSKSMGIPFPCVALPYDTGDAPQPYYVCPGDGNIPTVIHMPLFNMKNCGDRNGIEENEKKYATFQLPYSPEMISDLMGKAAMNVKLTKATLLEEIKKAKKVPKKQDSKSETWWNTCSIL